jgi:hypothetical protein
MFSSILDISSFFIGMLINLLLIALICYYFKRKYESLEVAQNEQAKILYNLIQAQTPRKQFDINELMNNNITNNINALEIIESDSDSDSDSDSESNDDKLNEVKHLNLNDSAFVPVEEIDTPLIVPLLVTKILDEPTPASEYKALFEPTSEPKSDEDYSKLTMKQLKDILSQKGISSNPRMKKNDLINLIETGVTDTLNLSGDLTEVII